MYFFKKYFFHLFLILISSFIFFYHLDYTTLVSFDEAWYGAIARNIVKNNEWLKLSFNGKPYYDHPPMGFWLMAISYKVIGVNEFSTRFPSALLGVFSSILILEIGRILLKNKLIGFTASLIMLTSVWYVLRVRSGNLDGFLVFFNALTVFLILKSKQNFKYFPLLGLSAAALLLTKTLIGLPVFILILFYLYKEIINFKKNWFILMLGIFLFALLFIPWYLVQMTTYPNFFEFHFLKIGMRNKSLQSFLNLYLEKPFFYLHMGVRKWYYPWLLSIFFILITKTLFKKEGFFLIFWNFLVLYPFLTSEKTELWHLIPTYLPMALIISYGFFVFLNSLFTKIYLLKQLRIKKLLSLFFITLFLLLSLIQFKNYYYEVFPQNKYIPDDVEISKRLNKYKKKIFLDDDFFPVAVFYSDKEIIPLFTLAEDKNTLVKLFHSHEKNFIVVTRNWTVNNLAVKKIPYRILEKNNSFSIVGRP